MEMKAWIKWQQKRLPVRFDWSYGLLAEGLWDEQGQDPGREVVGMEIEGMVRPCKTQSLRLCNTIHVGFLHHSVAFRSTYMPNSFS